MNHALHAPRRNHGMEELQRNHTPAEIIAAIRVSLQEFRFMRDTGQDLYARTVNARDHNELLNYFRDLPADVLALVPGLDYIIHMGHGNKYWHANLMTLLISELHRLNDILELADSQLGEFNSNGTCGTVSDVLSDILSNIHNTEICNAIQKNIA